MDANQVFATGGASGLVGVVGYLAYRFFFSKHRIVSRCCGKEMSLEVDGSTPRPNNINPLIDESSNDESERTRERERRSQSPEVRDRSRVFTSQESESQPDQGKGESVPEGGVQEGKGDPHSSG
jgi:hypothetical protein